MAPQGAVRILRFLHLADALGKGIFLSGSIIYFSRIVGLSTGEIGLGMSLAGVGGLVATACLGSVADRLGPRLILALMLVVQAAGFALYPSIHGVGMFLIVVTIMGFADYGGGPAFGAIIGSMFTSEQRVRQRAVLRTYFNIGFSLGSGISAIAIALGDQWIQALPLLSAGLMCAAAALVALLPSVPRIAAPGSKIFAAITDRRYMAIVALNFPLALHTTILLVALPLLIVSTTDLPDSVVPILLIANTVLVILFQVRASRGADDIAGASRVGKESGYWLAAACTLIAGLTALSGAWALLGISLIVLLLTLSELRQATASWGLAHGLAPEHARAEYIGTFNLHSVAQSVLGPLLVIGAMDSFGSLGWLLIAGAVLGAGFLLPTAVRAFASVKSTDGVKVQ